MQLNQISSKNTLNKSKNVYKIKVKFKYKCFDFTWLKSYFIITIFVYLIQYLNINDKQHHDDETTTKHIVGVMYTFRLVYEK